MQFQSAPRVHTRGDLIILAMIALIVLFQSAPRVHTRGDTFDALEAQAKEDVSIRTPRSHAG